MAKTEMMSNLDSVGDLIGALAGIQEGLKEDQYTENLIRRAHSKATTAFDVAAAATASTGKLSHVYEFGTAGITDGPVKHSDPLSAEARLWKHTINGRGGNMDIGYTFRPAVTRNPQPTTRKTGVPSKYLRKLSKRKYIFWNKAYVMETGMTVENRAKNGEYLFVPFNRKPSRDENNDRGYMMWNSRKKGPIETTPGASTKGTFTTMWVAWWAKTGEEIIEKDMLKAVNVDVRSAMYKAQQLAAAKKVKPSETVNVNRAVANSQKTIKKIFERRRDARTNR